MKLHIIHVICFKNENSHFKCFQILQVNTEPRPDVQLILLSYLFSFDQGFQFKDMMGIQVGYFIHKITFKRTVAR